MEDEIFNQKPEKEKSNTTQAFFNFYKSLVGLVVLDLPYAANECGYVLACIIQLILSYGTIRTNIMLIKVADDTEIHLYTKIVKEIMGPRLASFLDIIQTGSQLITCVAYIIFFQQMCDLALSSMPEWFSILISLSIIIPLSLIRDLHSFHKTSTVGFVIAMVVLATISGNSISEYDTVESVAYKPSGMFKFVGVAMFAYEGICTTLPVRYSMQDQKKFPRVFISSSLACLALYVLVIIINCVCLGNNVKELILFNLPKTWWAYTMQFLYALSILFTYPVQMFPAIMAIESQLRIKDTKIVWIIVRLIITVILYVIAYVIPSFTTFINILGMVYGTFLQFIFPISIYLIFYKGSLLRVDYWEAGILMFMGVGAGVLGMYFTIYDIMKNY